MTDSTTTVLLIDSHELVRQGIRYVLESEGTFRVVADAPHRRDAVAIAAAQQPDVIVLDPDTDDGISLDLISDLMGVAAHSRILILTDARDPHVCTRSVMAGAVGVVHKTATADVLFKAIKKLQHGEVWLDRANTAAALSAAVRHRHEEDPIDVKIHTLTRREREIVDAICEGLRNKEVADRLCISEATVRNHVTSVLAKLELADRFDLVVFAFRHRIVGRA